MGFFGRSKKGKKEKKNKSNPAAASTTRNANALGGETAGGSILFDKAETRRSETTVC